MLTVIVCPPVSLQCLYCEKTFRDKTTLKDHMRKKAHRRINASNHEYDRFYVINYLVRLQQEYPASTHWSQLVDLTSDLNITKCKPKYYFSCDRGSY